MKRSDVRYVEAHGDYARLVTEDGRHLVRVSLALLEEQWADGRVRPDPPPLARAAATRSTRCAPTAGA